MAGAIFRSLLDYEEATGRGYAIPDNVGFVVNLPNRRSFCPDAAFFVGESSGPKFLEGAPVFAVEVRSEEDYGPAAEKRLAAKRADYFAAGTRVVWDVDFLRDELVRSYSPSVPRSRACSGAERRPTPSPRFRVGRCPSTPSSRASRAADPPSQS